MKGFAAHTCSALLALLVVASACSGDDDSGYAPIGDGGDAGGGRGGRGGGGTSEGGGGSAAGGALPSEGGAGNSAAGEGGTSESHGGGPAAGAGGAAIGSGGEPPLPEPPDLVTTSGGPWPDSLTGICSNGVTLSACPQVDGPYFGQDGTYRINVPSYIATSTTLKDEITSLVWQVAPAEQSLTRAQAESYCDALELAGHSDWRLPTRLEYVSLLDEGKGAGYALPASIPFDTTGTYWTSSASGVTDGLFFVVDDAVGSWNVVVEDSGFAARCVRGAPLEGSQEVSSGVVTDTMTALAWQASELDLTERDWEEALQYCESLTLAGKDDWRLPSIKELATLVDETAAASPVIAASFGTEVAERYWSSSPTEPFLTTPAAFVLHTDFGISMTWSMSDTAGARCVRTAD